MKLLRKFYTLFRKEKLDAEMSEEMRAHLELQAAANEKRGMAPDDARYAAQRSFGGEEQLKERCRDQRSFIWLEQLGQDLRQAGRALRKSPGFAAVALLTLALGIGANAAIFSLVNAALLRALPFPHADRLAVIWSDNPAFKIVPPLVPPANADIFAWRRGGLESFERVAAFVPRTADIAEGGDPERFGAVGVSAGFFETLGVAPLLGRTLAPDEDEPGGPPVVLLSHGLWQRRFGGDPALVGRTISVNGTPHTVIGVMPPDFDFPRRAEWPAFFDFYPRAEAWLPLAMSARDAAARDQRGLAVIGRLKPGIDHRRAQAELDAFAAREAKAHPDTHQGWVQKTMPLRAQLVGKSQRALLILFAAVGLLLVIACVNVANLLLARGVARQSEMAVRAALGAGPGRLMRQLFAESLLLGVLGSGAGLLLAQAGLKFFLALHPLALSRLNEASLDPMVLGFTALISVGTSAVFGLVPAFQASRSDLRTALHAGGRSGQGAVRERVRSALVAGQVALAIVLLTVAGLTVRSFLRVQAVETGFRADSVLAFEVQLPESRYAGDPAKVFFFQRLTERLEALPGVRVAGGISSLPLAGGANDGSIMLADEPPAAPGQEPSAERRWVTPGYFQAMGIPLRSGRVLQGTDAKGQPLAVVVNERLARLHFGERDPVGQRLKVGRSATSSWRTIVGVVADVKSGALESEVRPQVYLPQAQWMRAEMTMVVQTGTDPLALAPVVRSELKKIDPLLPAARLRTMQQVVSQAAGARRFSMALLAFFAGAALFLTVLGLYGVVAFLVGHRRREIGVRIALGARPGAVYALVIGQGMKPVAWGVMFGVAGSLVASRLIASQLYGVSAYDPLTLATVPLVLAGAALVACWVPARRAARVDPMIALRAE